MQGTVCGASGSHLSSHDYFFESEVKVYCGWKWRYLTYCLLIRGSYSCGKPMCVVLVKEHIFGVVLYLEKFFSLFKFDIHGNIGFH